MAARGEQQVRSRERRERLLRAAVDLVTEGGVKALTHRAVSARAGLPPAAAGYYFTTSADLIKETLRFHVQDRVEAVGRLLHEETTKPVTPVQIARSVSRRFTEGALAITATRYELYLGATRDPELRALVAEATDAFVAVTEPVLVSLGVQDAAHAARAFVAVVDGFALHRLSNPPPVEEDVDMLFHAIMGLFLAYTMGVGEA